MSIQLKRSLTASLNTSYVLDQGQIGIEMPAATNTASSPFKFKIGDGASAWSSLPYAASTPDHTHSNYLLTTGTAAAATKLATARTIRTNLASTSTASFDGQSNITPGVTGTLGVANGGTGVTSLDSLKTALGISSSGSGGLPSYETSSPVTIASTNSTTLYGGTYSGSKWQYGKISLGTGLLLTRYAENIKNGYCIQLSAQLTTSAAYWDDNATDGASSFGQSYSRWKAFYAVTGNIQTSDERDKFHISRCLDANTARVDTTSPTGYNPGLEDIIELVQAIDPVTFCYKSINNPNDELDKVTPDEVQLGLIAQDISNLNIFPYIGQHDKWDDIDAVLYEDGTVRTPAIPAGERYALKPLPLAVAALTCCKYLLQRVEMLEDKLAS